MTVASILFLTSQCLLYPWFPHHQCHRHSCSCNGRSRLVQTNHKRFDIPKSVKLGEVEWKEDIDGSRRYVLQISSDMLVARYQYHSRWFMCHQLRKNLSSRRLSWNPQTHRCCERQFWIKWSSEVITIDSMCSSTWLSFTSVINGANWQILFK